MRHERYLPIEFKDRLKFLDQHIIMRKLLKHEYQSNKIYIQNNSLWID